jgi:prepilin-type N-terminal cleavage/methylation domain-containing protein
MTMKHMRGMTLLEMMVALAVLGILVSLAVVSFQGRIGNQRESEATRELWSSALRARQRSIATNQPVRIVVEPNVTRPDGTQRTVARWERLTCGDDWDNASCPTAGCVSTTCRATPACCSETGPDIVLPTTMTASAVHGLCFLPGTGRAVLDTACPQNIAVTTINARFTFTSGRARSLLSVDSLTGVANIIDCDSQYVADHPEPACTAP